MIGNLKSKLNELLSGAEQKQVQHCETVPLVNNEVR